MTKVLVIDNDLNTLETICLSLETSSFKVIKADGGQKGINLLKKNKVNLILCDIMMPEIDGIQVCKILADDEKYKSIPIILISALPVSSKNFKSALEQTEKLTNVKSTIEKPFQIDNLIKQIKTVLK